MRNRREDAQLDAAVHDAVLRHTGVVEPDEPTAYSHAYWMANFRIRSEGEFTPAERREIRALLGLGPFAAAPTDDAA